MLDTIRLKAKAIKEWERGKVEKMHDDVSFSVRAKYLAQWCEYCGVDNPNDIDYNEPHVAIEYLLCDPVNIKLIRSKKQDDKQLVYSQMTEEMLDIYFNEQDPKTGTRYCDLESRGLVSLARGKKKKNKGE